VEARGWWEEGGDDLVIKVADREGFVFLVWFFLFFSFIIMRGPCPLVLLSPTARILVASALLSSVHFDRGSQQQVKQSQKAVD
jgi:hypothetical protein